MEDISVQKLAKLTGISQSTLYQRLSEPEDMRIGELRDILRVLKITELEKERIGREVIWEVAKNVYIRTTAWRWADSFHVHLIRKGWERVNQLNVINIQRKAIQTVQIIDIQGQPKRSKCNDREETMSAIMTVVAMGAVMFLGIATYVIFGY